MPLPTKGYTPSHLDRKTGKFARLPLRSIEIPIGPSIAYVPLTNGYYSLIDREDAAWVGQWNWHIQPSTRKDLIYAARNGRREGRGQVKLHADLLGLSGSLITADHINRDGLDNRRSNLRPATRSEQCMNRRKRITGTSQFVGISKHKNGWRATVTIGLGIFKTEEDAHSAHSKAYRVAKESINALHSS